MRGSHDLGPHKIFTLDRQLMQRVLSLLPDGEWLMRDKSSSIYMKGYYLPYPPSPFSLVKVFGPIEFFKMCFSYGIALLRGFFPHEAPRTFEEDLHGRLGNGLYNALFRPVALKLWGDPQTLDVKLSAGRVQTPKLGEILAGVLGRKKTSEFEALTFRYPKGGLQKIWNAIRNKISLHGRIFTSTAVTGFDLTNNRVCAIKVKGPEGEGLLPVGDGDFIASTLPLGTLIKLLPQIFNKADLAEAGRIITLNDLLLVFLHVDKSSLIDESWVFVPDPEIAFHRISEQESFDPSMTPNGSIICCEIMNNKMRPMSAKSDAELIELALGGMKKMGYKSFTVKSSRVIRLPRSYPVYHPNYQEVLNRLLSKLDGIENLRTIGRQGAFNYIGTLDAMDIGYGYARWRQAQRTGNGNDGDWQAERKRTSHYPVLD